MRTSSVGPRRRRRRPAGEAPPALALLGLLLAGVRSVHAQCAERPECLDDGIPNNCPPRGQSCEAPAPAIATSAAGGGWDIDWDRCYRNPECALSYPLPVEPGDIITFRWVDGQTAREHNVVRVADGAAFAGCNKAGELLGRSPASYTVPDSASPGSGIYFVCGIGSHCEGGMKLSFEVVAGPPAAFVCYRWRRKREQRRGFLAATLPAATVGKNPTAAECGAAAAAAGFPSYGLVRRRRAKATCVAGEVPEDYSFGKSDRFGPLTGVVGFPPPCDAEGTLGSRKHVTVYGAHVQHDPARKVVTP